MSITFVNCVVGNNAIRGIYIAHAGAFTFIGGSIQYNGTIAGGAINYGIYLDEVGANGSYGTAIFIGVAFEGNGGNGSCISNQPTSVATLTFIGCSFSRTNPGGGVGYGDLGSIYCQLMVPQRITFCTATRSFTRPPIRRQRLAQASTYRTIMRGLLITGPTIFSRRGRSAGLSRRSTGHAWS